MRRRQAVLCAVLCAMAVLGALAPAAAGQSDPGTSAGEAFFRQHGYRPIHGIETYERAKAYSERVAASQAPETSPSAPAAADTPTIDLGWQGVSDNSVSPPDANGAIGPQSYLEIINDKLAIYTRAGALVTSKTLTQLTGQSSLSDPMVLWDPATARFYYSVLNVAQATMAWGFSKSANPTTIPGGFCNYSASFGYPAGSVPDYPKLGQTKNFLLIGVNFYPSFSSQHATSGDLLWMSKPQGKAAITTCPAAASFKTGKISNLRNQDNTQAFTPVPAIQTDTSATGFVVAMSDIECPDICGSGALITVLTIKPDPVDPTMPKVAMTRSVSVPSYTSPPDAPQQASASKLDTLDGRLTHAVSGIDPLVGKPTVWLSHAVLGGAGSEVRWYEVQPGNPPVVVQSGKATSPTLYSFNSGISNDRTVNAGGSAHGSAMVLGFTTSSSATEPASQMVSKVGASAQSGFVLVKQSTVPHTDFTCSPSTPCRWGDYGGATPDPAAPLGDAVGKVWLTNQWTNSNAQTWNWEATP